MKLAKIYKNIDDFEPELSLLRSWGKKIVATSGGFDPIHIGHLRCFQQSADMAHNSWGVFVVIVNGDGFLTRKKGKPFMPLEERMEIIAGFRGIDYVVPWDDGSQTVVGAIERLKINIFTKGGDRDASTNVPEFDTCQQIGAKVVFNVGGNKIQSSSALIAGSNQ